MLWRGVGRTANIVLAAALASMMMACAAIDSVGLRGAAMDISVAQYRNEETLRNIVRASREEPLNFSAFSSVTGHNTMTLGAPAITWNAPTRAPSEAIGSTTANTPAYNFSNDFNWYQLDDNATTSALLTPLDASTMAIFFEYGYPPDLLFLLFIHHIQIRENVAGRNGGRTPGKVISIFYGNRIGDIGRDDAEKDAIGRLTLRLYSYLADYQGLTFRFERATIPGQQKKPRSQLCFDSEAVFANKNISRLDKQLVPSDGHNARHNAHLTDIVRDLFTHDPDLKSRQANVPKTPGIDVLSIGNCDKSGSWIAASAESAATTENYNCVSSVCAKKKTAEPEAIYRIYDPYDNVWLELFTRSTYSMYRLLGGLIDTRVALPLGGFGKGPETDQIFFNVSSESAGGCFTEIVDGTHYCVPREALNTKAIFAILHQLAALYTFPSAAPANSSTVRITP